MKNRIGVIVLVLISLGLLIGLIMVKDQSGRQHRSDTEVILDYSNQVVNTSRNLESQKQVAAELEQDRTRQRQALEELTNKFVQVSAALDETSTNLAKTQSSLEATQQQLAQRDSKINELESQNQALDKKAVDLTTAMTNLTLQIADTQHKLAASEGDKAFLEKELKRMITEKAELERQFNDLTVLKAQVAKLKEELNIARRIEWIRTGLFASSDQKGAQKLMQGVNSQPMQARTARPAYDLNVEVGADGSVKVIPPASASTNAPTVQ